MQSNNRLLPGLTVDASAYALRRLTERGAMVHLGKKVNATAPGSKDWKLSDGSIITADAAFQVTPHLHPHQRMHVAAIGAFAIFSPELSRSLQATGSKVEPSLAPRCVDAAGLIKVRALPFCIRRLCDSMR